MREWFGVDRRKRPCLGHRRATEWTLVDVCNLLAYVLVFVALLSFPYAPLTREKRLVLAVAIGIIVVVAAVVLWQGLGPHLQEQAGQGLKSALITRVGDEHMGRFIREELAKEGVDVRGVKTDPERLTALVLLGIRDDKQFPLIFYRENCADMALCEDDIDEGFSAEARSWS